MPHLVKITVTAGRVIDHPMEPDVKLTPSVTLEATLRVGESEWDATKELQAKAEALIEEHKCVLLEALVETYEKDWATLDFAGEIGERHRKATEQFFAVTETGEA